MTSICSKGWSTRCALSKGRKCRCRCGGHNHGVAVRAAGDRVAANRSASEAQRTLLAEIGNPLTVQWTRFEYSGLFDRPVQADVMIIRTGDKPVVIATERADNPGASITNTIEKLAKAVAEKNGWLSPDDFVLIEHYPAGRYGDASIPRSLDRVTVQPGWATPTWAHIEPVSLANLCGPNALAGALR